MLATILYTDIVGSSRLAAELGDRRWKAVLDRHHLIVRKALKHHRGRELDNAGDGFLAAFDDQEAAIRCACAIVEGVRVLGIEVRAGLHVGQAEILGRKLGGIVVNAGARVMAEAGAGQVLVTGVLKDLVPGSGFGFAAVGERELKGIDGRWPLFAVTEVEGDPLDPPLHPAEAASRLGSIRPPPIGQRRWGRVLIWAAGIGAALVAVLAFIGFNRGPGTPPFVPGPNTVAIIDPATNEIDRGVELGSGAGPGGIAYDATSGDVFVANVNGRSLTAIDATTLEAPRGCCDAGGVPSGITAGDGLVWVANSFENAVSIFDPKQHTITGRVTEQIKGPYGVAFGSGFVWVTGNDEGVVYRIDPGSQEIRVIDLTKDLADPGPDAITYSPQGIWVAETLTTYVARIDPATLDVTNNIPVGDHADGISVGAGSVWVTSSQANTLTRVDPATNQVEKIVPVGAGPKGVLATGSAVWVACSQAHEVWRLDTSGHVVEKIPVRGEPQDLALVSGQIWVTISGG